MIWFCTLPKAVSIESVAVTVPPVIFTPVNNLPVTAEVDKVKAIEGAVPLELDVPVASPVAVTVIAWFAVK